MGTLYLCPKCNRRDHWANEECPKDLRGQAQTGCLDEEPGGHQSEPAPIKQAVEFLKRVGRPKKYPDRKTQMREVMRRKRERERAKI